MTVRICRRCHEPMCEDSTTNSLGYGMFATLLGMGGVILSGMAGAVVGFLSGIWGLGVFAGIAAGVGIIAWVIPRRQRIDVWLEHQSGHSEISM